ncbi:EscU/YscU/HrcU family type III secretion system export apparatus switch protein [Phenylobacterium sp.]|uniref:EscU/YscU/HrcU family type III secretion system export apparatus switch protein n=1 Tax=Phenylobacterium sp. TaxID=1871053 RepID=UPI0025DA14FC|nr:EscU/YscU/HrcU family type III secretion system export apparatus switch protein [Phenylobacterium sp.]MBX3483859.1 EscU/YscU/HrcU family type III secretion system export apparatus switch protein [Phenylobacterium sp.]MCW5759200.1 EscU/YscU/HrcU family type III secretion system export apparatus switch protein [Phenylobacterium sp.]
MSEPEKPTLAVALHYEAPGAPKVVAVGRGELGQRIIDTAREHGVPLEANPALAEALSTIELDSEIPEALYEAVAVIIAFIINAARQAPMQGQSPLHR